MLAIGTEYAGGGSNPVDTVFVGGEWRRLPHYKHDPEVSARLFATYGADSDTEPLVPEADWIDVDWSRFAAKIKDQDGKGACLVYATAKGLEYCRSQEGLDQIALNAMQAYGQIRYPQDQGSDFPEVLVHATTVGFIPESVLSDDPDNWNPAKSPSGWKKIAADYRAIEVRNCPTKNHVASALQRGWGVVAGVSVTSAWDAIGPDGVLKPYKPGQLNHGIFLCGSKKIGGQWYDRLVNSWSAKWGDNGCIWHPRSALPQSCPCYAIRSSVFPAGNTMFHQAGD